MEIFSQNFDQPEEVDRVRFLELIEKITTRMTWWKQDVYKAFPSYFPKMVVDEICQFATPV